MTPRSLLAGAKASEYSCSAVASRPQAAAWFPLGVGSVLIWMPTPPQAFHTDTAEFNSYELLDLPPGEADLCRPSVADYRRAAETEALRESGAIDLLRAAIVLEGVEHLGHSKVGNGFRSERQPGGDCTHYCMPGVPDEMARVLYNILIAHAHVVR